MRSNHSDRKTRSPDSDGTTSKKDEQIDDEKPIEGFQEKETGVLQVIAPDWHPFISWQIESFLLFFCVSVPSLSSYPWEEAKIKTGVFYNEIFVYLWLEIHFFHLVFFRSFLS